MHMNDSEMETYTEIGDQVWARYGHIKIQVRISVFV